LDFNKFTGNVSISDFPETTTADMSLNSAMAQGLIIRKIVFIASIQ